MLEYLLICDTAGQSLYHRKFRESFKISEPSLLSGLISEVDSIGRQVFNKQVAVVTFGEDSLASIDESVSKIVVISKELFGQDKRINFVFFSTGDCSMKILRQVVTTLYMEIKNLINDEHPDNPKIGLIVDKVIDNNFKGFKNCF